ncbi:MAG: septation protein SepH, partial [Mycobacterium sp.]
ETVSTELVARGLDPEATAWDAWRNEDGRWTVQMGWTAGRSELQAHFRFAPGAHGGTVTAFDDAAHELIDPSFARPLRPLAPVAQLSLDEPDSPVTTPTEAPEPPPAIKPPRPKKGRPAVPAWEDVLLGVRSSGGQT